MPQFFLFFGAGKYHPRELLPLPGPAVTLFLSTHLSSPVGSRRRTAALWVSAVAKAINYLFCAGWTGRFVAVSCLAHPSEAQETCLCRWFDFVIHFLESCRWSVDLTLTQAKLGSLKLGYAGQVVARGLSLVDSLVGPAWPRKEHTGLLPVVRFLDGESVVCDSALRILSMKRIFSVTTTANRSST